MHHRGFAISGILAFHSTRWQHRCDVGATLIERPLLDSLFVNRHCHTSQRSHLALVIQVWLLRFSLEVAFD